MTLRARGSLSKGDDEMTTTYVVMCRNSEVERKGLLPEVAP